MNVDAEKLRIIAAESLGKGKWQDATDLFRAAVVLDGYSFERLIDESLDLMRGGKLAQGDELSDLAVEHDLNRAKSHYLSLKWEEDEVILQSLAKLCYIDEDDEAMFRYSKAAVKINNSNAPCVALLAASDRCVTGAVVGEGYDNLTSAAVRWDPGNRLAVLIRIEFCLEVANVYQNSVGIDLELLEKFSDEDGVITVQSDHDYYRVSDILYAIEVSAEQLSEASPLILKALNASCKEGGWYRGHAIASANLALGYYYDCGMLHECNSLHKELLQIAPNDFEEELEDQIG